MNYIGNFFRNHLKGLVLSIMLVGFMVFSLYNLLKDDDVVAKEEIAIVDNEEINKEEKEDTCLKQEVEPTKIYVDIKGAVVNPGVYEVSNTTIINDVVKLAGGFKDNAYYNNINLSKKVKDEMVIFIYTEEEIKSPTTNNSNDNLDMTEPNTNENIQDENNQDEFDEDNKQDNVKQDEEKVKDVCEVPSYDITECVDKKESVIVPSEDNDEEKETPEQTKDKEQSKDSINDTKNNLVNINTADVTEFTTIKGIGEAKAKAIIKYREANGNFKTIEEIKKVSGIGDATFEKIKAFITV